MVCRTILFWEFGVGIMNILYLKWFFPLAHWLWDNILYWRMICPYNLVLGIWGWSFFQFSFDCRTISSIKRLFVVQSCFENLGWYSEYLLFEMVFSACPLVVRQYFLFKNGCRTILLWELGVGIMNIFDLKWFFSSIYKWFAVQSCFENLGLV